MACVELEVRDGIGIVRYSRPPANAIDLTLTADGLAALDEAARAPAIRGVVLTGRGACFSAGIDTKVVPAYDRAQQQAMVASVNRVVERLYGLPKPVVAAVNGHALGGGLVMAIACDARVVTTESCKLGLTEVTAGIPFPAAPIVVVRAELGPETARTLVLTGRVLGPREAEAMRLADELAAPAALVPRACELARTLAAAPSYGVVKRQLRQEALAAIATIVAEARDPLLEHWL